MSRPCLRPISISAALVAPIAASAALRAMVDLREELRAEVLHGDRVVVADDLLGPLAGGVAGLSMVLPAVRAVALPAWGTLEAAPGDALSPIALGLLNVFGVLLVALSLAAGLIWVERRLLALWQDRYGPNRVGPFGLLQVVADVIKILTKEDWIPPFADRPVFVIAPAVIIVTVLLSFAVVPVTPGIGVVSLNIGLLFFLAMSSLGVYSVVLAAGPRTASTRCSAACARRRRC